MTILCLKLRLKVLDVYGFLLPYGSRQGVGGGTTWDVQRVLENDLQLSY